MAKKNKTIIFSYWNVSWTFCFVFYRLRLTICLLYYYYLLIIDPWILQLILLIPFLHLCIRICLLTIMWILFSEFRDGEFETRGIIWILKFFVHLVMKVIWISRYLIVFSCYKIRMSFCSNTVLLLVPSKGQIVQVCMLALWFIHLQGFQQIFLLRDRSFF